jgi:hypothetical protein
VIRRLSTTSVSLPNWGASATGTGN